jgi:hypothetical protein
MLWKSESEIREIVRDEIRLAFSRETDYRIKRIYDEHGNLIETDYTWSPNLGHIVHVITKHSKGETEMFAAHSRSHQNWEELRAKGENAESADRKFTEDSIFSNKSPLPPGFVLTSAGVLMPEKETD